MPEWGCSLLQPEVVGSSYITNMKKSLNRDQMTKAKRWIFWKIYCLRRETPDYI